MDYNFEELKYLGERLGLGRPEVANCLEKAAGNPGNIHVYKRHFLRLLKNEGFSLSDLSIFSVNFPEQVDEHGIFVGNAIFGNGKTRGLFTSVESYQGHTLIAGKTRSGKSTLTKFIIPQFVERGIYPWIFDYENEYKSLLHTIDPEKLLILDLNTDRDNFLEPPPGVSPLEWESILMDILREQWLRDGSLNLAVDVLRNVNRNNGVYSGSENYPTILDVLDHLRTLQFKTGTRYSGYHESLINRFRGFFNSMGNVQVCIRGFRMEDLLNKCVIFNLKGLSDLMKQFFVNLKMQRLKAYLENLPPRGLRMLLVVDEAHKFYNREIAKKRNDLGKPMIFSSARTFAKRGMGFFFLDQAPSELPPALFGNVEHRFTATLNDRDSIRRMGYAMNMESDQARYLPVMKRREYIHQSGDFPYPVLFEVPEIQLDYVSDDEVRKHMENMLPDLEYTPVIEELEIASREQGDDMPGAERQKSQERPNRMWTEAAKLLAEMGYISLSALYASLGNVSPWYGRKILKNMENQNMIELCPISFGTRGNPKTFVVLKAKGAEFIGVDYDDVKLRGKGSTEHVILQNLLAETMKDSGKTLTIEHHINGKSVDIAEIREDRSIAYEIELAPSQPHVVENVLKDLEAEFDEVIIITRNQIGQNEAKNLIYKNISWERISKVNFRLIREFL